MDPNLICDTCTLSAFASRRRVFVKVSSALTDTLSMLFCGGCRECMIFGVRMRMRDWCRESRGKKVWVTLMVLKTLTLKVSDHVVGLKSWMAPVGYTRSGAMTNPDSSSWCAEAPGKAWCGLDIKLPKLLTAYSALSDYERLAGTRFGNGCTYRVEVD